MKPHEIQLRPRIEPPQDAKVGRHREKLDIIRDSLRPFVTEHPPAGSSDSNGQPVLGTDPRLHMVDALLRLGYDKDTARYALRATNFTGIEAATAHLRHLNDESMRKANGIGNGNYLPFYPINESTSSRSTSPQLPSPSGLNGSRGFNVRQVTPVTADMHRTHIRVSRAPSYKNEGHQQIQLMPSRPAPVINIERNVQSISTRSYMIGGGMREQKNQLESTISAPAGSSQIMVGGSSSYASHPVIRTTFSNAPRTNTVNINVRPGPSGSLAYRLDVSGKDGGISSVHGTPGHTSVQNIIVDPEMERTFVGYEDELRPSTSFDTTHTPLQRAKPLSEMVSHKQIPERSTSPIPESIRTRLQAKKYERYAKQCQPRMYCFYMEQHVERLLLQYREREKRSFQLQREMEAANLPDVMKHKMLEFLQQKESKYMRLRRQKMDVSMFEILQHIGVGAFGKVSLVKKKDSNQVYAMKSLLKKDVIMKQQAAHVKAERDILSEADSPWIVKLFFSFQDDRCLYFVMEYVPGGDMMQLLINMGIFTEKLARFYIAELTCAIDYVHSLGFIHRDIKPDNILIDQQGHVKLTDFGLCTGLRWTHDKRYYGPENDSAPSHIRNDSFSLPPEIAAVQQSMKVLHVRQQKKRDQAHSVVGTGNYMAPEVIQGTGHTQLCDWWSVGVILYEMVIGRPPFMSEKDDPKETREKIIHWQHFLDVSPRVVPPFHGGKLSQECLHMITSLCRDKRDRLGSLGAQQVQQHLWFKGIDFKTLRSTKAEFIPRVDHAEDTSNFDPINIPESPLETLSKRAPNNPAFYEFTFRHFFDHDGHGCPSLRPAQKRPSLAPLLESNRMAATNSSSESIVV